MDYLSFSYSDQHFAVPLTTVRFIAAVNSSQVTRVASGDGQLRDVVEYEQQSCPLLSLSELLQQPSLQREYQQLYQLLEQREQDHIDWLQALEHSLTTGVAFTKARDPHQCAFGQWYDRFESDNDDLNHVMNKFDAPHKRIHALADELLKQADQGQKQPALQSLENHRQTTLVRLRALFSDARQTILESIRPSIVLLQAHNNSVMGLQVDNIGEVFATDMAADQHCDWLPSYSDGWLNNIELDGQARNVLLLAPQRLLGSVNKSSITL